ncbi:glycosyltransferase [Jidongwangia harbinensis]|uniref:glycosyltransferase n=1 Tax=Jidongwangia harbinensis TaxID=2878561 RepID=UPI001CD9B537|nr:glycosyltransferase [Jidongwangia harbinensis]MCA2216550.1 glycosyltransferase [Jidongwangia harbinensis]
MILDESDVVVSPTQAAILRNGFAPSKHVEYIAAPSDLSSTAPAVTQREGFRRRWRIDDDARVVLFVGRLHSEKSTSFLLTAFGLLLRRLPSARLVLVGTPVRRAKLALQIERAGVLRQTICTGNLNGRELEAAYSASDVFAFPSTTETQGLVLHEAALARLPTVIRDSLLHSCHPLGEGLLLTEESHVEFSDGILRLLTQPGLSAQLVSRSHRKATAQNLPAYGLAMLNAYQKAVEIHPPGACR